MLRDLYVAIGAGITMCLASCASLPGLPNLLLHNSLLSGSWSGKLVVNSAQTPTTDATGAPYSVHTFNTDYTVVFDSEGYPTAIPTGGFVGERRILTIPVARDQWSIGSVIHFDSIRTDEWISDESGVAGRTDVTEYDLALTVTALKITADTFSVVFDSTVQRRITMIDASGQETSLVTDIVGARELQAHVDGDTLRCTGRYQLSATYTNYGLVTNPYHVDESFESELQRASP